MIRVLANSRVLAVVRLCAYAAIVAGAATAPNIPQTVALLGASHAPVRTAAVADPASATLGWLGTPLADTVVRVAGFGGLAFFTALALALTLALVEWRARRTASPAIALGAALLGTACLLDAVHVGDGATNAFFCAALLATFDLRGPRAIALAMLVTALWCNVSPVGILAPVLAIAFAMGGILDRADKPQRMHAQTLAVCCALATLATPALIAFPAAAWRALALDNSLNDVLPGAPSVAAPLAYYAGLVLTMVVALAVGVRGARSGDTFVFGFAAICAFSKGELVPFVGIAAAPVLAETATRILNARGDTRMAVRPALMFFAQCAMSAALVALAAGIVGGARFPGFTAATAAAPYGVLARYARDPAQNGRLLCTKLAWCDVAERTYGFDVIADTRVPSASDATIAAQRTIAGAKKGWHAKIRSLDVNAIFTDKRSGFATLLLADGWRPYGTDGAGALFVRTAATL